MWIVTLVVAVAFLAVDVFVVGRRPHEPSMREVTRDLAFFIGAALLFCAGILVISGPEYAAQFLGGWLTEYSLSIDNLFVFLVIIAKLKRPPRIAAARVARRDRARTCPARRVHRRWRRGDLGIQLDFLSVRCVLGIYGREIGGREQLGARTNITRAEPCNGFVAGCPRPRAITARSSP